jgi:hypothetical protein
MESIFDQFKADRNKFKGICSNIQSTKIIAAPLRLSGEKTIFLKKKNQTEIYETLVRKTI